jgi:hypothetical protein
MRRTIIGPDGNVVGCPTCGSSKPHLHPAVQHGGEVVLCADPFHLTPTPQNLPEYISAVEGAREIKAARDDWNRRNGVLCN